MIRVFILFFMVISLSFSYTLKGSGATFVDEVMEDLMKAYYENTNLKVSYLAIGSVGGLKQLKSGVCDFCVIEVENSDKSLEKIPFLKGQIVLAYNVNGVDNLVLSADLIAKIYLGEIIFWDDKEILNLNKNLKLPHKKINFFHRYDGSGTTFVFSEFLSSSNTKWKDIYGSSEYINLKFGIGKRGNLELGNSIKDSNNSIGYISYSLAKKLNLNYVNLMVDSKILSPEDKNYPLVNKSYFIYKKDIKNRDKIEKFINFIKTNGNDIITKNKFIP